VFVAGPNKHDYLFPSSRLTEILTLLIPSSRYNHELYWAYIWSNSGLQSPPVSATRPILDVAKRILELPAREVFVHNHTWVRMYGEHIHNNAFKDFLCKPG